MRRRIPAVAALGALVLAAACGNDPLSVNNKNSPTVESLLTSSSGTETLVSKIFQFAYNGQYGASDALWPQLMVMGAESEATVANFGMLARGGLPRANIDNTQGNAVATGNFRDFSFLTRASRQASLAIAAVNQFTASYDAATGARNRSFAYFTLGYSLGHLALAYDSAYIITPSSPADSLPNFSPASQVMTVALAMLDTAQTLASSSAVTAATIPVTWIPTTSATTMPNFVRLIRSYKARLRASMPRTPAEAAAVDWAAVLADAQNGIQANVVINASLSTGWPLSWISQAAVGASWHQMPNWYIGMADTTGAYATWLNTVNSQKLRFLIRTPDRRFPSGETRAAQQAAQPERVPGDTVKYFRNRPTGQDATGGPTGGSQYDVFRFYSYRDNNSSGQWVLFARAEVDMLAAEAAMRTNQLTVALPLIDRYRTRAGLPALVGVVTSMTTPVPGGNACVPKTPVKSGNNYTLQCGTAFEAMKYEKRLETAWTGWASSYFDARRFNDLINNTPLEWPVPYQETDARGFKTPSNSRVADANNTYGWVF